MDTELHDTMQILKKYNQEHLLNFYDELTEPEKETLLSQIHNIDFDKINKLYISSTKDDSIPYDRISPIPFVSKSKLSKKEIDHYSKIGNEFISKEKLAIITLAGGQGTRLGYKGPKGSYEIDVPPKKSLFEFACDNLKKLNQLTGISLRWYIMTSPANDTATKNYFESKDFFGYPKDKIKFFVQNTLPIIDINTNVILETPYSIKSGSNGNGDVFKAFASAGFIDELEQNNIEWVFIGGIDNILLNISDPILIGLTVKQRNLIASKSVVKSNPKERVGVFGRVNGKPKVIEYTELPEKMAEETDANGNLIFGDANILNHLLNIKVLEDLANVKLPYHIALKKAGYLDEHNNYIEPTEPNAYKFEAFIFDAFERYEDMSVLRVKREDEFAPIKNAEGADSPETAKKLYNNKMKEN